MRDELLDREVFDTLWEVQVLTAQWRNEYNHVRPHRALGYRPPAPVAILTTSTTLEATIVHNLWYNYRRQARGGNLGSSTTLIYCENGGVIE